MFTFLDPTFIDHEVAGRPLRFYPATVKTVFRLRGIAKPLAKALSQLFAAGSTDRTSVTRRVSDESGDQGIEQIVEAISPELAQTRADQRSQAIEEITTALLEPKSLDVVQELIVDSLRDDKELTDQLSISEIDVTTLAQFLTGLAKANFKALPDPLAQRLAPQNVEGSVVTGGQS